MSFFPHTTDTGAVQPWEYMSAAAGSYQPGQLLNASGGKLMAVSAVSNTTPGYLCMAKITVTGDELVPVSRIKRDAIYETTLSAAAEAADIGTKLRVSAGGLQADAGAAGSFEVTYIEGTEAGSVVRGRFT